MNSQRSLTDQLHELVQLANKHGLYDAADHVSRSLERTMGEARTVVSVSLDNILGLVFSAEDYGHGGEVFYDTMANMLKYKLSDEEIEAYAKGFLTEDAKAKGYTEEDYENAKHELTTFRDRYCKPRE